ncbi:DUF1559 family PulG-like putative transporter [Zavarzinella formosa]|uniref:DUF1559 family PulG-like putative transporter n=1 Tax=Zavarzinella formosa TaxID=360055 RepID=UPI0002D5EB74|nr:DUF1559 domain-containing protein [Zavarzinella formosa]
MNISPKRSMRAIGLCGLLAVAFACPGVSERQASAAPLSPLDRVSPEAGVMIHGRASVLWNHPLVEDLRKQFAKPLEKILGDLEKSQGLTPEQLDTVTFHFPKIPAGPGDETLFIVQVVTKTPYDRTKVLGGLRAPKAEIKNDVVEIAGPFRLHLTSPTQFTVLHESLLADFVKGPGKATDGPLAGAIKAAKDPANTLTLGLDPSGLPNEIFTAAPPELQPFLPLLKSKNILLTIGTDKEIAVKVRFTAENGDKAQDSERSLSLLKKLADTNLGEALNEKNIPEEMKEVLPALKELHKSIQAAEIVRKDTEISASLNVSAKAEMLKPVIAGILGVRTAAGRAKSSNNLKQLALAVHNYHDVNGISPSAAICDKKGKPLLSWRVSILPYIEQDQLYKQFKLDEPWDSDNNKKLIDKIPPVYVLPYQEQPKKGETSYLAFVGNGALFDNVQGFKLTQIPDGTSNTILFVESSKSVPWTKPEDIEYDPKKPVLPFLLFEKDVCQVSFADGSVRAISKKVEDKIWHWLIQPNDGNVIPALK